MAEIPLHQFLSEKKEHLIKQMIHYWNMMPSSPYKDFITSKKGQERSRVYIDFMIKALQGEPEAFLNDLEKAGFRRAAAGYSYEDVMQPQHDFIDALDESIKEVKAKENVSVREEDLRFARNLILQGYQRISKAFIIKREEQIQKNVKYLEAQHGLTREIVSALSLEDLFAYVNESLSGFFGVSEVILVRLERGRIQKIHGSPLSKNNPEIRRIISRTLQQNVPVFIYQEDNSMVAGFDPMKTKLAVSVPVVAHGRCYAVIVLRDNSNAFDFAEQDFEFVKQYLGMLAVAIENASMIEETDQGIKEMRLLTATLSAKEDDNERVMGGMQDSLAHVFGEAERDAKMKNDALQYKETLTKREFEILCAMCQAIKDKEIAEMCFISEHTVRSHIKSIFMKLEVSSRTEAVIKALKSGLVASDKKTVS